MAQDTLTAYAQWLVENQDKKGTPEFNKVAQAFQMLQAAGPQQQAAPTGPQYEGISDLAAQRGRQFAQGATEAFASLPEAAAIAGAGNPNAGALVVSETVQKAQEDLAALEKDYQERVAAYREADRDVPTDLVSRYNQLVGEYTAVIENNQPYLDTVTEGGEVNLRPAAQDRALFGLGDQLRQVSDEVFGAPQPNDQSFWAQVAQGGGTVAGMIAQGPLAIAGGSAMNSSQLYKEAIDAGATEEDARRAAELGAWVGTTEIIPITRALKLLPPRLRREVGSKFWKKVSDVAQSSGEEAAQEYAQTVANNLIAQEIYDPERGWNEGAAESALVGAVIGGGVGAIGVTLNNSLYTDEGALKNPEDLDNTQQQAAGDLARTFSAIAGANDWNLTDIDKTSATGARAVVDTAHVQLTEELRQRFTDMASRVSPNEADTFNSVIEKILARAAYREGRNKTKNLVGNQELDALRSLAGDTREGQEAINLLLQLNQLTELHNSGYQGGLSAFTDQFSILGSKVGYDKSTVATERLLRPILSGGAALSSGGASLPAQMVVSGGGRALDRLTGNYSQIDRFVRRNADAPGLPTPTGPSLRDAAAEQLRSEEDARLREEALRATREEEQRQLNLQLAQQDAPPTPTSPQFTMEDATGLSRDGVARILRVLKGRNNSPALIRAIEQYEQSVATGGRIEDLSPLIRAVRQFQQENPDYVPMVRPPNSLSSPVLAAPAAPGQLPSIDTTVPDPAQTRTFGPQVTTQENYNRGIEANQAMNAALVENVASDPELSRVQRGRLITSLDVLANNLGSDPVAAAQEQVQGLQDAGVPQEAIDKYVQPYVDRVARQQSRPRENTSVLNQMIADDPKKPQAPRLTPEQIPTQTRKVYKLMKVQKSRPGEVLPLFAKSGGDKGPASGYTFGEWFGAENQRPKLGNKLLAQRPGIHAVNLPVFDQGKAKVKGEQRVWVEVEIPAVSPETQAESDNSPVLANGMRTGVQDRLITPSESYDYKTNPNASMDAGGWPVAGSMKALRIVPDAEIAQILRDSGLDRQVENSFSDVDAAKAQELMQPATPVRLAMELKIDSEQPYINPFNIPEDEIGATRLTESPSEADIQKMRDGTYKPKTKRTLVEAADYMYQKWKAATGRDEPFEYTPENVDTISTYMATEAVNALQSDANAIGWYDRKLKAAKRVVSLVDPRVTQSADAEAAFDFALSVTSNGQAVADNFQYAHEVFSYFMDNGKMPTDTWGKGGERNAAMTDAFNFFNAYQTSGANMPIQDFLDQDFTVKELNEYISRFNSQYGTEIKVPSSEGANAPVKGSYIIGPKIGQGFYQNIRGNYDPLTMDIWWMRMWNRLVGRPFETQKDVSKNRARVREAVKLKNQDQLEKSITNEVFKEMGIKRSALKDDAVLDAFVRRTESKYQSFFRKKSQELKGTKQKVPKPELFKATGTMVKNLNPQLQAQPKGPNERAYMRDVTKAAIAKLGDLGYNIETADFQALMWYPEKQLFRHLGVAPGRGADNDYLDAAIMLAESEGITNDQIQEALSDADGDGTVDNQSGAGGVNEGLYRGPSGDGEGQTRPAIGVAGVLANAIQGTNPRSSARDTIPSDAEVKQQYAPTRAAFQVGKKGTDTENGIKDVDGVNRLAEAVGLNLKAYGAQRRMSKEMNPGGTMSPGLNGLFNPRTNTAAFLKPGVKRGDGTIVSENESFITALHELAHGIAAKNADGSLSPYSTRMTNNLTGASDAVREGSFEYLIGEVLERPQKERNDIRDEIIKLQDKMHFTFADGSTQPTRDLAETEKLYEQYSESKGEAFRRKWAPLVRNHRNYVRNVYEMSVDPLIWYLFDPKAFKKEAPKTAKLIRDYFNEAGKIQFFSHPLAMGVAVVLAMLAKADQEDEQKNQMPPGALNQPMPMGALSA